MNHRYSKVWTHDQSLLINNGNNNNNNNDNNNNIIILITFLATILLLTFIIKSPDSIIRKNPFSNDNKMKKIQIDSRHNLLIDIDFCNIKNIQKFIREQSLICNDENIVFTGFSKEITFKELNNKSIVMGYLLVNFAVFMHLYDKLDSCTKNKGKGFLDSFVRELSYNLCINDELNIFFIQDIIYKITTFLGIYMSWDYKDTNISLEAARFINTKLKSLYFPLNQNFEYKGIVAACNLFGFIMARILDCRISLKSDITTYRNEKKLFELQPGDSIISKIKKNQISLIWDVQVNKDLGFTGSLPSGQIYTNCQKYDKLHALSCQAQLLKQIDCTVSDNLSNMVDDINFKIRHNKLPIPNLNMFYSLERKYIQPLKTDIAKVKENYGIQVIPTIKYLRFFTESLVFATRALSLDTTNQPALIYDTLEDTTIGLYDLMSVSPIFMTDNDLNNIISFKKAGLIYKADQKDYNNTPLITITKNIDNSCVFIIDDTRAIKYQSNVNLTFNPGLWYSELIDLNIRENKIIITRLIHNNSNTEYKMNMDNEGKTYTFKNKTLAKTEQIYCMNSNLWTWSISDISNKEILSKVNHMGDVYTIKPPVNFHTPIMKNDNYWLLCPSFNYGRYDIIKILPVTNDEMKATITFKYSEQHHGQWMAI